NSIRRLVAAPGGATLRSLAKERGANGATTRFACRIRNVPMNVVRLLTGVDQRAAQSVRLSEAGNLDIVGLAIEVVGMKRERARAGIDTQRAGALVGRRIAADFGRTGEAVRVDLERHPIAHDIDETA